MLGFTYFVDDIGSGEFRSIGRSIAVAQAPVGLWVQVEAREIDDIVILPFGNGWVDFAPEGSTWSEHGGSEYATVTKWFDLGDAKPGPQGIPFKLETGPRHIDFSLSGRLLVEVTPGSVVDLGVTRSAKPTVRAKTVAMLDRGARAALAGRRTHVVQLTQPGYLYLANPPDQARAKGRDRNVRWTRLDSDLHESLMVVAAGDILHLLAVGKAGEVLHRALSPDATEATHGQGRWTSLGGSFVWPVAVAATPTTVDLFALSADGGVFYKALTSNAGDGWKKIGEGMVGSLSAFTTLHSEIGIVAVDSNGSIQHLPWTPESDAAGFSKWRSLGPAPRGALSAEVFDDVVVFAALAEDETVNVAPWRNYPEPPAKLEWQALGTMNSLISARYSLLPAPRAAAESACIDTAPEE
jgi:hypothetical protein